MQTLRENIQNAFEQQSLSMWKVCNLADIGQTSFKSYLEGKSDMNGATLDSVMEVLGINYSALELEKIETLVNESSRGHYKHGNSIFTSNYLAKKCERLKLIRVTTKLSRLHEKFEDQFLNTIKQKP